MAQQVAQVTQLARRDVGLRQQIGAQQVRQRPGVDGVGLDARRGDRLGAHRVCEVQLVAGVLEHVGQPLPAVGRLQRDPAFAEALQQRQERLRVVDDSPRQQLHARLVERRDVRALAMQIDTDRIHLWASPVGGYQCAPRA